ncbi:MAG: transcription antitermination factor NusB [Cyanobacteria bacterium P01_D01_bin.105]
MKARSIAREMALLGVSQLADGLGRQGDKISHDPMTSKQLDRLLVKALTSLGSDAREILSTVPGEEGTAVGALQRGEQMMLESDTRTTEKDAKRDRLQPAVALIQTAINQVGSTLELLIFAQQAEAKPLATVRSSLTAAAAHLDKGNELLIAQAQRTADIADARQEIKSAIELVKAAIAKLNQSLEPTHLTALVQRQDIRDYACDLLHKWTVHHNAVDIQLNQAMEYWNMGRLARVDRDILRLAMLEILHVDVPTKVAIDEAIEMAKRYSDEDGYRFINGVLRRATDKLKEES